MCAHEFACAMHFCLYFCCRLEFRELTTFVELTVKYKPGRGGSAAYLCGRCMSARMLHFRQLVRRICTNKFFQIIFELLVYVNGVLIMLQFGMDDTSTTYKQIDIVQQILLTLFGVEVCVAYHPQIDLHNPEACGLFRQHKM